MIPKVYEKAGKSMVSPQLSGYTQRLQPSIEFIIIGQSRHEKDLVLCLMRILARCLEVLRQFDFPLKGWNELFEPRGVSFERNAFRS